MSARSRLFLILGIAALLCTFIQMRGTPTVQAQGTIIWSADHEEVSDVDWYLPNDASYGGGEFTSGCAGASPGYLFGRNPSGSDPWPYSLLLMMAAPCGDLLKSGTRMFRWQEPRQYPELYYKVWYYFPQVYTVTGNGVDPHPWWNIFQWMSRSAMPPRNDPFFHINIANGPNGNMYLYLRDSHTGTSYVQTVMDVPVGQWFSVEAYYKSRGDNTGQVTIWQDGTQLWNLTGVQTRYPDAEGGTTEWSVNNYGNGTSPYPAYFYIDDAEIRTP